MSTLLLSECAEGGRGMTPERLRGDEDLRLARALKAGDPEALTELHARFAGTVFGYLLGALADRGAAEDVCQQVFTEVWTRGAGFDPARASLLTWIMMITRSRAIDELRRRRPEPLSPHAAVELVDAGGDERDAIDALLTRWQMAHLLTLIEPGDAELLRMRFYDELTQTEIAGRTGLPLGTVKTRMVRGLERLADLVRDEERAERHGPDEAALEVTW